MGNKWTKVIHNDLSTWPENGKLIYVDTNHGKYLAHTKDNKIYFDESIHFNGPITEPPVIVERWKYISKRMFEDIKGILLDEEYFKKLFE